MEKRHPSLLQSMVEIRAAYINDPCGMSTVEILKFIMSAKHISFKNLYVSSPAAYFSLYCSAVMIACFNSL